MSRCLSQSLASATADLQAALIRHGYAEAIIFGHALDGNLHFVFAQGFADDQAIRRYADLMEEVAEIIVGRYDGSLKAEHGTGRNMAPFVEMEWGKQATDLMWRIKKLFDPLRPAESRRNSQRGPLHPPQKFQAYAGDRPAGRSLHRVWLL